MIDLAKDIATLLSNSGLGTLGSDLFIDNMPDDKNGLYIVHAGGELDKYTPMQTTIFDIYAKYQQAQTAVNKLESVLSLIHRMHSVNLSNTYLFSILGIGSVEVVDILDNNDKIYKITISVINRNKLNIS
jgi:hypothetical protein